MHCQILCEWCVDAAFSGSPVGLLLLLTKGRAGRIMANIPYHLKRCIVSCVTAIAICHHLALTSEDIQRTLADAQAVEVCELADVEKSLFLLSKYMRSVAETVSECI